MGLQICNVKKRRVILFLAGLIVVVLGAILLWPGEREPEYQRKKLSEWIRGGFSIKEGFPEGRRRIEALHAIGTNALPFLTEWMNYNTPPTYTKVDRTIEKLNRRVWNSWWAFKFKKIIRAGEAMWAFEKLGPQASPAIPGLVTLMGSTNIYVANAALYALDVIGKDAIPVLLGVLTNRQAYRVHPELPIAAVMRNLGTNSNLVVPVLIECLTNKDSEVAANAAVLLGGIRGDADRVVPALANTVAATNEHVRYCAVYAIRRFGDRGRPGVPALIHALDDPARTVRAAATNTLREIAPEVLEKR
jgi:hypothetical protein